MDDTEGTDTPPKKRHRQCAICRHPQRAEIEAAMSRGIGRRQVGKLFNVSPHAAGRHFANHLPTAVKVAARTKWITPRTDLAKLVTVEGEGVLVYLQRLRGQLLEDFEKARADGHYPSIAVLSRELRGVLAETAKLTGELRDATSKGGPTAADISTSREYLDLRGRLLGALRKHPAAFADVMREFELTEAKAAAQMTSPPMIEARPVEVADANAE